MEKCKGRTWLWAPGSWGELNIPDPNGDSNWAWDQEIQTKADGKWLGGEVAAGRWEQATSTELLLLAGRGSKLLQLRGLVAVTKHWDLGKFPMPTSHFLMLNTRAHR